MRLRGAVCNRSSAMANMAPYERPLFAEIFTLPRELDLLEADIDERSDLAILKDDRKNAAKELRAAERWYNTIVKKEAIIKSKVLLRSSKISKIKAAIRQRKKDAMEDDTDYNTQSLALMARPQDAEKKVWPYGPVRRVP